MPDITPMTRTDFERGLRTLTKLRREIEHLQRQEEHAVLEIRARYDADAMEREIEQARHKLAGKMTRLTRRFDDLQEACRGYALLHRDDLLGQAATRTIVVEGVTIKYRAGRPSVKLDDDEALIIKRLRQAGYTDAIRIIESVDRRYILSQPHIADTVTGLRIDPGEDTVQIIV